MRKHIPYFILIVVLFATDQISKFLIARNILLNTSKEVIPGFFQLVHIHNKGAIFGFFSQSGSRFVYIFLTLASLVAMVLVVYYFFKASPGEKLLKVSLSLIIAGALGNFADRIFKGYVIDFLDVSVRGWHWPSFNVADSFLSIGIALMIISMIFDQKRKHVKI